MNFLSVIGRYKYSLGGFYDDELGFSFENNNSIVDFECARREIFPANFYTRPPPALIAGPDEQFNQSLRSYFDENGSKFSILPPVILAKLHNVVLSGDEIFIRSGNNINKLYETFRANDRPYTWPIDSIAIKAATANSISTTEKSVLYLGSSGSGNYGHWLVDDLPRILAIKDDYTPKFIILPSHSPAINKVKIDSISMLLNSNAPSVIFTSLGRPSLFSHLDYVTPISYHPWLKSSQALREVRYKIRSAVMRSSSSGYSKRIFVTRGDSLKRLLINQTSLLDMLNFYGFTIVVPETLNFVEQVRVFANADTVLGIMGAAMANTLFCDERADIAYLAPNGWVEPFYWDLAAVLDHKYYCIFGSSGPDSESPHMRSFSVDRQHVELFLRLIDR